MARTLIAPRIHQAERHDPLPAPAQAVPCNPALLQLATSRRVLLLQGPVGPFFDRVTQWLQSQQVTVERVVFQAGDRNDCQALNPIAYTGDLAGWPAFFDDLITRLDIDCIVLFGQSRAYHQTAIALARQRSLSVVVLEEGYIRPGYITMELDGVNGFSTSLSRFHWSARAANPSVATHKPRSTDHQFQQMAWFAIRHYWAMRWHAPVSGGYEHHKSTNIWQYSHHWTWSWIKKHLCLPRDNARVRALAREAYFFVPLQHDGDAQIKHHSPYSETTEFIIEVMRSFAHHAPAEALLVFRQHPHSRGGRGHAAFIASLATELGVGRRVMHLVEGHTPTLVKQARGTVVVNSTVGLQALMRRKPLAVLGDALYKQPGLSFSGPLDRFWTDGTRPDEALAHSFLEQLIALTQAPCNVYGLANEPLPWTYHPRPALALAA